jgi:hypothetical protein
MVELKLKILIIASIIRIIFQFILENKNKSSNLFNCQNFK